MKTRRSTVVMVVLGVFIALLVLCVGAGIWFFVSVFDSTPSDEAAAAQAFEEVRQRIGVATPIIEIRGEQAVLRREPPTGSAPKVLQRVQILTWDPDETTLSRVTLPWWLVRMKDQPFDLSGPFATEQGGAPVTVSVEDIERYGPALLLDHAEPNGSRVVVWTE